MSSLTSSQSSLPTTRTSTPTPPPTTSTSSSFYLPTSLALTASGFLRRFYTEPTPHSTNFTPSPPRRHSPFQPPPLHPLTLNNNNNGLEDDEEQDEGGGGGQQLLLSRAVAEEIRSLIPPRLQLADEWRLAYSLERDGVSLGTLYERCEAASRRGGGVAFVVVVRDGNGGLFGAYLTDAPRPSPHYYGTGECFLWRASVLSSTPLLSSLPPPPSSSETSNLVRATTIINNNNSLRPTTTQHHSASTSNKSNNNNNKSGRSTPSPAEERIRFKAFPYSGVNDYMIFCEQKYLSVGGGDGRYGLWLDDVFEKGISSTCPTFGNEPLSDEGEKFDILGVEVWSVGA